MSTSQAAERIWSPKDPSKTNLDKFRRHINQKRGLNLKNSVELHAWTTNSKTAQDWWIDLFEYEQLLPGHTPSCSIQSKTHNMFPVPTFFPDVRMNFSEHILSEKKGRIDIAMYACSEGGIDLRSYTWAEMWEGVERIADGLITAGIQQGDRVAAIISNCAEAVMACLAVLSIGAIWTTSAPDMGQKGIMDRLIQVQPRLVIFESSVKYNGKTRDLLPKYEECLKQLEKLETFQFAVFIERELRLPTSLQQHKHVRLWTDFLASGTGRKLTFKRLPFNHPGFIVYSSGTTGAPKCMVHSACAVLMQVKKDYMLSMDVRSDDVVFQYTTTGWIMWAMVLCGLAYAGKIVVYDGSPLHPDPLVTLRLVEKLKITLFGTSARFLSDLKAAGVNPRDGIDLSSLRTVTSTGSVLGVDVCKWFYNSGLPKNIHLVSTSGGTDMACSLVTGDPTLPVYAGEIQGPALGMAVSVYDAVSPVPGVSIEHTNSPGELVCTQPFPSQPVCFWNADGGARYRASYFERFGDGVWCQGDFVRRDIGTGGFEMLGRSDGVLNPSGIRFGSSELYEALAAPSADGPFPFADTLAIGQRRPTDADETVLLFVKMQPGQALTSALVQRVKATIQAALSPRHVPKYVFAVPDIPYTINGKKIEIAVKQVVSGVHVVPSGAVANPESLDFFKRFVDLEGEVKRAERAQGSKL